MIISPLEFSLLAKIKCTVEQHGKGKFSLYLKSDCELTSMMGDKYCIVYNSKDIFIFGGAIDYADSLHNLSLCNVVYNV